MLNARPSLIFNASTTAEHGVAGKKAPRPERAGESFASYFKAERPGAASQSGQTIPDAVASAYKAAQAAASEKARPVPEARPRPEGLLVKSAPEIDKSAMYAAHIPEGGRQAAAGRPAAKTYAVTDPSPVSARQTSAVAPRISGRPVTGRNGFGILDTRRRATADDISGSAASIRRQNAVMLSSHAPVAGQDAYARFGMRHSDDISGRSFLSTGFASKNAETALKKLGYDMRSAEKVETRATLLEHARTRSAGVAGPYAEAEAALAAERGRKSMAALGREAGKSVLPPLVAASGTDIGGLAAKFESGEEGIAAIGYDGKGGTSYGKFQIASRAGTMRAFIEYLREKAPDLAGRLAACGPANTGSRSGRMPAEWRRIAAEQPERFEQLQGDFIRTSHFEPAVAAIAEVTGVSFENLSPVLREVLFSTAVQHGPAGATRIVGRAMAAVNADKLQAGGVNGSAEAQVEGRRFITHIYNLRAGRFGSSSAGVQEAVRNRLKLEMREALGMLV
ncbi:MAG: hypothetical protein LBQ51_09810 [Desulfovibrio sp.]|nr:hypothetical protein [Desulfovibrio sp.]